MKAASPVTEVKFNPETLNLGLFQIYGSVDRYKILPRPFYRLLVLFQFDIAFFPPKPLYCLSELALLELWLLVLFQGNVAIHRRNRVVHLIHDRQSVERIISTIIGLTQVNVCTESCRACYITSHLSVDFNISSQGIAKGVLPFVRLIKECAFN